MSDRTCLSQTTVHAAYACRQGCGQNTLLCLCAVPQVHAVLLDDIMQQPQMPELSMITDYESRSLR
jgi:hypothetical protein